MMMSTARTKKLTQTGAARLIEEAIRSFARHSPLNRMPTPDGGVIFDEPLVQFADGDDPIFTEYKTIIDPTHLTPREALAKTCNKNPEDVAQRLSVISWVLPITNKTRGSNRRRKKTPSRLWTYTRWYGEKFNDALREHVTNLLTEKGYLATAPMIQPYYERTLQAEGKSYFSNWSERHIAYAAGLGTFSLSDGFITERGIAHRCGSVVTDMLLPPSRRTAEIPYANCLFYANHSCQACINRCPAGAITEKGHDKLKCHDYLRSNRRDLSDEFKQVYAGCGLCQTRVPCEASNPVGKIKKRLQNI